MGAILAVINQKGGVGKTTLALNLAGILAGPRRKVAVVDTDPQRSAFRWSLRRAGTLSFLVHFLDARLGTARFRDTLESLARDVDLLLVDTPPKLAQATLLSALLADMVLIPVSPSSFDVWGAEATLEMLYEVRRRRDGDMPLAVLVPSKVRPGTKMARDFPADLSGLGEPVGPPLAERVAVVDAVRAAKTINQASASGPAVLEYRELAVFILKLLREKTATAGLAQ